MEVKILVLGNETETTDQMVSALANSTSTTNHGLISDNNFIPTQPGYYHTSVVDMPSGAIAHIAREFDAVQMLDQPKESYPHFKTFLTTLRLMYDLELDGVNVIYKENKSANILTKWRDYLKQNRSFCYAPFTTLVDNAGSTTICSKSYKPLHKLEFIRDWKTDPVYQEVRNKMIAGELMPDYCADCYGREEEGLGESARQFETLEWAINLSAETPEDFVRLANPYSVEIRPSNKCNIMCRMCDDGHSHLLEREWQAIGMPMKDWKFTNTPFDKIDFTHLQRIYIGGGEPTVMPEFYEFLEQCISTENTNFELLIGTNGFKFSNKLVNLLDQFKNVTLAFSFDGYKQINDYIRWKSEFDTIVENSRMLREHGHTISLQTVFSMWNATSIHKIFEFFDREYPDSGLLVQVANGYDGIYLPYNHPRPDLVLESMLQCQQTQVYYTNGRSIKGLVDLMVKHYSDPDYKVDVELLRKFYEFNDKLDKSRNCKLGDYIPELEEARNLYL